MARSRINEVTTESDKSNSQLIKEKDYFKWSWKIIAIVVAVSLFLFCWGRSFKFFKCDWVVDNSLLGTFGDFIGGIIGTGLAFYSVYLLYRTLQAQIKLNIDTKKVNDSVIETNRIVIGQSNLQLFDNKFNTFLKLYKDALDDYKKGANNGRDAFTDIMKEFIDQNFNNNSTYLSRAKAAVKLFEDFYAKHTREMSVHLRMLYNVVKLIGDADNEDEDGNPVLNEEDRVIYAKSIRAQLSDEEMLLLRYNCHTEKGKNMQVYVNEFNLIKHLSIMSLLEFRMWRNKFADDASLLSYLNAHFISLRKEILLVLSSGLDEDIFVDSRKYQIIISSANSNKKLTVIIKIKNVIGGPGIEGEPQLDKCLNRLTPIEIGKMYKEFLREMLLVSNFYRYNGSDGSGIFTHISADNMTIKCRANGKRPWIVASWQIKPSENQ